MRGRILLVEDDFSLLHVLTDNFAREGFDVRSASNGPQAIEAANSFEPDVVILDIMLPDTNGFELCPVLRQGGRTPVIILTARGNRDDKLRGLNLGADDYVTKPFDLEELIARVHAVLRRTRLTSDRLTLGSVVVDFRTRQVSRGSERVMLTDRELEILEYLMARQHRIVLRTELLHYVWGYPDVPQTRSVDQAVARLRKKIEPDPQRPRFIHTVHGCGYRLTPAGATSSSLEQQSESAR